MKTVSRPKDGAFSNRSNTGKEFWIFLVCLGASLCLLFFRSFDSSLVLFSNDGPLGAAAVPAIQPPGSFSGVWMDLNSLGNNAGAAPVSVYSLSLWLLHPLNYSKFFTPLALFILGVGAWFFFHQLKLSPLAAMLGGLAAALNSAFLGEACWGVATHAVAIGMDFCALALIVSNSDEKSALMRWIRLAVAGFCVGINVMEAADIGAIFSVFIAAFAFYKALNEEGVPVLKKIGRGILRVAIIAIFAGFIATQTVVSLVSSQIVGIAGTAQTAEAKAANWDKATQWSLPKIETLGLFVPGLFGYRMDTPKDILPAVQDAYKGGNYWGGIGRDPAIDRYFDSGSQGAQPGGFMRFSGGGDYAGILVVLLVVWTIAQSFRRENSVFTQTQKRFIWFWTVVLVGSLLMSWGRFAPLFYKLFYALPYASTMRNPCKFVLVLSWAIVILFGYGIHALSRRYLEVPAANANSISVQLKSWWTKIRGFDRNWIIVCILAVVGSVLAWLVYASEKPNFVGYLEKIGFADENTAKEIAAFSVGQVGWFIPFFAAAVGLCLLVSAGIFSGKRARLGGILLGALLILDLGRANLPWIVHWDYKQKYEIGSLNPIVSFLKEKPYEHRVAQLPFPAPEQFQLFGELYGIEWMQHLFPYYNVQSLDKVQMPRMPADLEAYEVATAFENTPETIHLIARRWQLSNTRYLLGPAGFLDVMNTQLDPEQKRFHTVRRFNVVLKPGVMEFHQRLEELTAVPNDNGDYALFEFTGALPRAKLYSSWQIAESDPAALQQWLNAVQQHVPKEMGDTLASFDTNDLATLHALADKNFDPQQIVLLSKPIPAVPATTSTNENPGTVEFKSYAPKDIVFNANVTAPSVLLLNDKFDPNWSVTVDGKSAELLRCNFIMRGVFLTPGAHTVEFQFSLPHKPFYITLAAIIVGIFLIGLLIFLERKQQLPSNK
jgi:hypothetical protein